MMARWDIPKHDQADVVTRPPDGVEAGATEVLADQETVETKSALAMAPRG